MRAYVNQDGCIGCGLCNSIYPAVFSMNEDNLAQAIIGLIPETYEDNVKEARDACPASVIDLQL